MSITFEKWENGQWFIVYPDYDGDQEDLEMVDGADELLDFLTTDGLYVTITVSIEEQPSWPYIRQVAHDEIGGTYQVCGVTGFDKDIWLCNVVHNVLGEHPQIVYFMAVD